MKFVRFQFKFVSSTVVELILPSTAFLSSVCSCLAGTYREVSLWVILISFRGRRQSFNFSPGHLQAIFQNNPISGTYSSLPLTVTAATVAAKGRIWRRAGKRLTYTISLGHPWQFIWQISPPYQWCAQWWHNGGQNVSWSMTRLHL